MKPFEYTNPFTVGDAIAQLGEGRVVKAGGIDLLDRMKNDLIEPKRLVNIRNIGGLSGVTVDGDGLRIGPLTTLAQLASDAKLREAYPAISDAALHAATPQIRNMATAGGNLLQRPRCWYFRQSDFRCLRKGGDGCFAQGGQNEYHSLFGNAICAMTHPSALAVPLTAFDAVLELTGPKGKREVPIADFYVTPETDPTREHVLASDELLTGIRVPAQKGTIRSAYFKQKQKESNDWPLAELAVVLGMSGGSASRAAVVLGAAAPVPLRSAAAERELTGRRIDEAVARRAASAAMHGATPLAKNGYKTALFETIIRRTILEAAS